MRGRLRVVEAPRSTRRRWVVLGLSVALVTGTAGGCGDPSLRAAVAPTPTTQVVPATPDEPISVVVAGDSVLDNLAVGLVPALDLGGEAVVSHTWLLGLSRDAASKHEMRRTVAEAHPDVVVVLLGVWELDPLEGELGTPGWEVRYRRDVLDPFVDMVTVDGAQLLWLGMPATSDPVVTRRLDVLNRAYADLDHDDPRVTFLDLGEVLESPEGEYRDHLSSPDGTRARVRQTDGLHFCPAGTERAAQLVLDALTDHWSVAVADGWEHLGWTDTQGRDSAQDLCPDD